jgi:hypothetical protein
MNVPSRSVTACIFYIILILKEAVFVSDATVSRTNATELDKWKVRFLQRYTVHVTHTLTNLQRPLSDSGLPSRISALKYNSFFFFFATAVRLLFLYNVHYFRK